ncbi:capsule assembly Wzi family protein [Maribellus sp. YY47]|uniref:capsule assembly Wzi family protein n=1 Tax=Maribellus sp. YY47 TaxID=2929486 RepID=UPI002001297D|nr:capsule assembly Wzi family protein [Maribellus sp. YY47]MCK3685160.1 capsule assembly Wzi family protein [Maribellus sp. YY47]
MGLRINSLAGTKGSLPFWMWANQLGRYSEESQAVQNLELNGTYRTKIGESYFSFLGGGRLNLILADKSDIRFTELYGGLNWKTLLLTAGAFADQEKYDGLSTTNGNLAASLNARPHPKIRAGFNRFVGLTPWLSIYGFYEEGWLNDDRYVTDTHLHRKAFYFRIGGASSWQVTGGLEHFVMWGGTHPVYGKLQGWEAYLDYILAKSGDENSLATDQDNIIGSSYGTYQLEIKKSWDEIQLALYLSHPFEDQSGMEWVNYKDNLLGIFLTRKEQQPLIKSLLLEYFHTKNQSGDTHLALTPEGTLHGRGRDNYYNNSVYRSGATYQQMAMVSPLFTPVRLSDGISMGFENTRFSGFHLGATGFLSETIHWKGLLTYSNNFGQYKGDGTDSYQPSRKQAMSLFELKWMPKNKSFDFGASIAADHGSLFDQGNSTTRLGAQLSVRWHILN